jgi:hypothetical protein
MSYVKQPAGLAGAPQVDLGDGHWMRFLVWNPDMALNPQYAHLAHLIREHPVVGAIVGHNCSGAETGKHEGVIYFHMELTDAAPGFKADTKWSVKSWEPLTISPSLLSYCQCKDHGFIENGKWRRA